MSKVKVKKQDTFIDMTAMSDVTVLLLTFFMLTANFIPREPVQVITPASVSEVKVPDYDLITLLINPQGKVFLNFDRPADKEKILEKMGELYGEKFTTQELAKFREPTSFAGVPIKQMKKLLSMELEQQDKFMQGLGVPVDSANNQLAQWIKVAKSVNKELAITIKADQSTPYPMVKDVMSTLQDIKENRFSLVTNLRGMPEGL